MKQDHSAHGHSLSLRVIRSTITVAAEAQAASIAESDDIGGPQYSSDLDAQDLLVKLGTIIPAMNSSLRLYSSCAEDGRSVAVWGLSEQATQQLSTFDPNIAIGVLLDWNRRLPFTTLVEPRQPLQRLLTELVRLAALALSTKQLLLLRIEHLESRNRA